MSENCAVQKWLTHIHDNDWNGLPTTSGTQMNTAWVVLLNLENWEATIQGCWFNKYKEVTRPISEWLQMKEPDLYDEGIFKTQAEMSQMHQCAQRSYTMKSNTSVENISYIECCNHFSFTCYGLWNLNDWIFFDF